MAHNPVGMPRRGYVQTAGQVLASPRSSVCDSAAFLPLHTHTAHALPQPLQPKLAPHTAPVSRLEAVTIPVSPQPVQQSPEAPPWPTRSHLCPTWAWARLSAQQTLQGINLPWGWGSSSTSLCPTRLNPQHLPRLPGGKGRWYPATTPNQHPPASSQLSPSGGERMRHRSSHPLVL